MIHDAYRVTIPCLKFRNEHNLPFHGYDDCNVSLTASFMFALIRYVSSMYLVFPETGGVIPHKIHPSPLKLSLPPPTWRTAKSTLVPFMINILWLMTSSRPCGSGGEAPAQGQHRTTLRWWRIIIICCWPPCRCHVREGDKAVSIDTAHVHLQRRQPLCGKNNHMPLICFVCGGALPASTWQSQVFVK